mgnify:CR=1 FL=1
MHFCWIRHGQQVRAIHGYTHLLLMRKTGDCFVHSIPPSVLSPTPMTNIRKGAQPTDVIGVTRQELGQITPTGGGQSQDFEGFQRNNVYQITAKVGKLGIQIVRVSVEPWGDPKNIDVDVEL